MQARRNAASKDIGKAKAAKDEATAQALMQEVAELKDKIAAGEEQERELERRHRGRAGGDPEPAARRRAGRHRREGQQGGAQGRHAAAIRLQAQAALRDRRGAGPDGLRDGGQGVRRALRVPQGRSWRGWSARIAQLHARPAHGASSATPRSTRRCWCAISAGLRHGAIAEVRRRTLFQHRTELAFWLDPHRRGVAHQHGARADPRPRTSCRCG